MTLIAQEYMTTHFEAQLRISGRFQGPWKPLSPKGKGWRLHSVVATTDNEGDPCLFYTWQRDMEGEGA
jgi:hypothetical protein